MYIQLFVCFLFAIVYALYRNKIFVGQLTKEKALTKYIRFVCIVLIIQSGFRNVAVGADTYAYYQHFENILYIDWHEISTRFIDTYETGEGKDPGYLVFMKLFSLITSNFRIYLIFIAIIFFSAFGSLLRTFCNSVYDVFIGGVLYEVLYYGFFSVTGIRQTLAIAILFVAVRCIISRKLIPFLILCIIAATIHKSAFIFIPFYFIAHYKSPIKLLVLIVILLPLLLALAKPFAQILTSFSFSESYSMYSDSTYETSGAQIFLAFMLAVSMIAIYCRKEIKNAPDRFKICCNAFSLGLLFTPLTWVDPSLMRVGMYFTVFSLFFLGQLIIYLSSMSKISLGAITMPMVFIFVLGIIKRASEYAFFWQEMALGSNYGFNISTIGI